MDFPKFVMVSDGRCTGVLLDGVFIGEGILRLDFSTENKDGEMKSTIRIMDLDVKAVSMKRGAETFSDLLEGMGKTRRILEERSERN